jgi:AbrB family looped-hinge helix DNA binding protein
MKAVTRLTSRGQGVIPKPVRDRLRWKKGTRLQAEPTDDGAVILRPQAKGREIDALIEQVSGCLSGYARDPLAELEAEHRAEIEKDERRLRRRR